MAADADSLAGADGRRDNLLPAARAWVRACMHERETTNRNKNQFEDRVFDLVSNT